MFVINNLRNFKECEVLLKDSKEVHRTDDYIIRKKTTGRCLYYGLYDKNETFFGYVWLVRFINLPKTYQVYEFHIDKPYQKKGYGITLYKYLLLHDKITIISDLMYSEIAVKIWNKLIATNEIKVGIYNYNNNKIKFEDFKVENAYKGDHLNLIATKK